MMDSLIPLDAPSLLGLVFRATILLSAALTLAWLARTARAGVRHLLWTMTFTLLLALPVFSLLDLSWEVPILPSAGIVPEQPFPEVAPVPAAASRFIALAAPEPSLPDGGPPPVRVEVPPSPPRSIPVPLLLWAVGCAAALISLATGGVRLARLVRAATPLLDPIRLRQAEAVRERLGIRGDVRLLLSPAATTPMTGGLLKRVVLFPVSATAWSPDRWRVVLTHEMIHVRRRDVLRQLMARAVLALYWFHPLSWVAARLAAIASEEACDEEVLTLGTCPSEYATHLLALAGSMGTHRSVLTLPMAEQSRSQLERRIMAILTPRRPGRSAFVTALLAAALGGAGVSAAVVQPIQVSSADTVTAVVAATIGSSGFGDEQEEYILGNVTSVAADRQGQVYVADGLPPSVRAFNSDGEFTAWIGRQGEGPGEFTWGPVDILAAGDGRLFVRGERITTFVRSSSSEYPDSVVHTWSIPPYPNTAAWRARLADGVYYYPDSQSRDEEPVRYFYVRYGPGGLPGDTVQVPDVGNLSRQFTAYYMINRGTGRLVPGLNVAPFAPRADWDMTERGTIIAGGGETYRIQEFDQNGQILRTIDGPQVERRVVPRAERADSVRVLEARIDSLPVPLDDVLHVAPEILRGEIPDSLPAFVSLHVGASDRIWVERWPLEGQASSRYYDVLEYDGRYAGTVVVPAPLVADPPPFFGDDIIVGVVMDPATEVHSVVVLRFQLPG